MFSEGQTTYFVISFLSKHRDFPETLGEEVRDNASMRVASQGM